MATTELPVAGSDAAGGSESPAASVAPSQRDRILDVALELMSSQGAGSTSMRQLARACDLNVAGIYHYFPSKADLLRSVIEERQYGTRLLQPPPVPGDLSTRERFIETMVAIWAGAIEEEQVWRLLLGEAMHGDETALSVARDLLATVEPALGTWVSGLIPELADRSDQVATVMMGELYRFFVERMLVPTQAEDEVRARATILADLLVPSTS